MSTWQDLVAGKRRRQAESIPKEWIIQPPSPDVLDVTSIPETCGLLTPKELEITNTVDVGILLSKLATAEWSSVEVTTAFYKRAIVAHQLVNCLTEIFVEKALARAAELDEHLKKTGKVVGPLHGLPVSLKDQLRMKGLETVMGYVSWIGKYAEKNAVLVDCLYEVGAVPFVQTNVPQTLMWPETFNNVFGRTVNPYNRSLTSGGSSGGEGALIGLKGSPLGVGSDIGGSVRIPSAFNGLYGLRPSFGRVPYAGAVNSMQGQDSVPSVFGPISNSMSGIKAFLQAIISTQPWLKDPLAIRKKWDDEAYALSEHGGGKKLCFGILWSDGITVPHPPVTRALEMTKAALEAAGHTVVDWVPYRHKDICNNMFHVFNAGALDDYIATTASTGEPIIGSMDITENEVVAQTDFRPGLDRNPVSAYQLWQIQKLKTELRQEYLAHWNATVSSSGTGRPVDALVSPCAPYAAPPHGKNTDASFTMVWNALDYTCCVVPVTKVDQAIDVKKPAHKFLSDTDKAIYELYEPSSFMNAPVSVQVIGRTQEEEAVIAMAEIVDAALKVQRSSVKV